MMSDALVILGAAGIVIPVFARFRITPVIGFILVGLLVGPFGLGRMVYANEWLTWVTITDPEGLEPFAEFGIILLLFTIGLELSFNRLWTMRRLVFGLGALELAAIGLLLAGVIALMGQHWTGALGLGLALALSSTALVLPIAGTHTAVGRAALSRCKAGSSRAMASAEVPASTSRAASTTPQAAAMPIAGAPRTTRSRIAVATASLSAHSTYSTTAGSRRWSSSDRRSPSQRIGRMRS